MTQEDIIAVDRQILAALIASLAQKDESAPPFSNTSKTINGLVLAPAKAHRDFGGAARLTEAAANECEMGTIPWCYLMTTSFNFARRMPDADYRRLKAVARDINGTLDELPDEPRKHRVMADLGYGLGVLARDHGDFETAMQAQGQAADAYRALSLENSASISDFLVVVECTNMLLVRKNIADTALDAGIEALTAAYQAAKEVIPESHGWFPNLWLHMGIALIWANRLEHPLWTECRDAVLGMTGKRANQYHHWMRLFRSLEEHTLRAKLIKNADEIKQGDVSCTAMLLEARETGEEDMLNMLQYWPYLKGHVPRAIASRDFPTDS